MSQFKGEFRNWLKKKFDLYDIEDLQIGGHCGCCGAWISDEIFPNNWWDSWGLCKNCRHSVNSQKVSF